MVRAVDRTSGRLMADDHDFASFYAATYRRLVVQLLGVTGNLHDAEDVVQEAMARAAVRWRRVSGYAMPEAWVRRVAFNLAVSASRRSRRFVAALARIGPPPDVPGLAADDLDLIAALGRLPHRYREVLVLHYLADLPVQEIAAELRVPVGTVSSRLARGRAALVRALDDGEEASHARR
jgi:RNA polymerase sigma-70 factor, ECF subfamily